VTDTPTPPLRRWGGLIAAVLLVSGGVGVAVWDRERAEQAQAGRTAVSSAEIDLEQRADAVDSILARRSAAVMAVDEEMFLADVDPTAKGLVARQKLLFANLVNIGLAELTYQQRDAQFDQAVVDRHGPTAYLVRVWMTYRIKGIDPVPVKTEIGYTFVRRGTRWVLVDDDDLDAGLTQGAHREPWDVANLEIHRGNRVLVLVDRGRTGLGQTLVQEAEEALANVNKFWPRTWSRAVLVIAVKDPRVRGADFAGNDSDSAASSTGTYSTLPGEVTKDGTFAGAYVVINPKQFAQADEIVLSHEFTHVATARLGGYEPLWLAEGTAEYVSWKGIEEISGPGEVAEWESDVQRQALPRMTALPPDEGFYDTGEDVYGVSWLAVRYLVRDLGIDKVATLYEHLAEDGWNPQERADDMRLYAGLSEADLFDALKTYDPSR
jgi:hypothetical protein